MRSRMCIEKPDDVEVTLTLTMKASEWCDVRDQLQNKYPSWQLSSAITDMLSKIRKIVYAEGQ